MLTVEPLTSLISKTIASDSSWRIVTASSSLIRAIPTQLEEVLPPIGNSTDIPDSAWLTFHFWIDDRPRPRLGVFWRTTSVRDREIRNRVLKTLLESGGSGFVYKGAHKTWSLKDEPAFSGKTVSNDWWRSAQDPDLSAARDEIRNQLKEWTERLPSILGTIESASRGLPDLPTPAQIGRRIASEHVTASRSPIRATVTTITSVTRTESKIMLTPPLPDWVKEDRFQPYYTNIHSLLNDPRLTAKQRAENTRRLYGTETMDGFNDWNAPTLLLAKDAGPMQTFLSLIESGDPKPWRHADSRDVKGRQTNDRLRGLASIIPGTKLYGSVMAGLLRNDGKQRGALPNFDDPILQSYIRGILTDIIIPRMKKLRVIICLGNEACRTVGTIIDEPRLVWEFDSLRRAADPIEYKEKLVFAAWHPVASERMENVRPVWAAAARAAEPL